MGILHLVLLVLAAALALSTYIVAKKPDAKRLLDRLVPYQAFIGIALLLFSLVMWLDIGLFNIFRMLKYWVVGGIAALGSVFSGILLGAMHGMPQIAKWIPGESPAEAKALAFAQKLGGMQVLLGGIALASAFLALLIELGALKP